MGERHGWVDPTQAMFFEGKLSKERRSESERMDGRTHIVSESRQGQLHGAGTTAYGVPSFNDPNGSAGPGEFNRGGEPVGASSYDNRVVGTHTGITHHSGRKIVTVHGMGGDLTLYVTGDPVPGYLALPEITGPWPGVLVLHEAFGLNDDIRRITDRVAKLGYLAVAPDLLAKGRIRCLARLFLDIQRGGGESVEQVGAVVDWVTERADCNGQVGVIGFCIGGSLAFLLGCDGDVAVTAPNYGKSPSIDRLAGSCPVVASYGGRDRVFVKEAAKATAGLTASGVQNDVKIYPGAGHSFMNQAGDHRMIKTLIRPILSVGFHRDAAEDAWSRIEAFFNRHLG
jgi:carboxymethylenebutenolidase